MKRKEPIDVIKYPYITEAIFDQVEDQNKIVFIVDRRASKIDIKKTVEELYEVQVVKVNTLITPKGNKKAFVTLHPDDSALDLASQFGIF
ncbi:MAG: 50S ribosomal protein L23 [Candidatus Hodarchaeales archaeon]|jgi:large subunit ribosomal protein L23